MKNCKSVFLSCLVGGMGFSAHAQSVCPTPDLLMAQPVSIKDLYDDLRSQNITKGEFETTAQFEARKSAIADAPSLTVRIELEQREYDADREVFKVFIPSLGTTPFYRDGYHAAALKEIFGTYEYGSPVQLLAQEDKKDESEYEGTNAYGARTVVTQTSYDKFVVFDNKGRRKLASGDNLFGENAKYETAHLLIPAPLDRAPEMKSQITMVALIDPRAPFTFENDYRIEPTRDLPRDLRYHYSVVFADIQCVGAFDGSGALIAHWQTR